MATVSKQKGLVVVYSVKLVPKAGSESEQGLWIDRRLKICKSPHHGHNAPLRFGHILIPASQSIGHVSCECTGSVPLRTVLRSISN